MRPCLRFEPFEGLSHAIAISSAAMVDSGNDEMVLSAEARDPGDAPTESSDVAESADPADTPKNYDRDLGVIEAITVVTRSCPNGRVVRAAKGALEAIKGGGPDRLREQAYFVLTAIQGWRGDRAVQVHRSLSRYLDQAK